MSWDQSCGHASADPSSSFPRKREPRNTSTFAARLGSRFRGNDYIRGSDNKNVTRSARSNHAGILAAPATRRKRASLAPCNNVPIATDLVLLGAGHAHVEVLRRFAMRPEPGVRLTLIGREPETPYTGMLPGLIRGDYSFDEAHIDLAPLAAGAGARLILAEATDIDLAERRIAVTGRPAVPFDLLSIDIGGEPAMPPASGQPVKPIGQFLERLAALEAALQTGARIAVVGGGPGGTELALALARRYRERARIVLVCETAEPLATAPSFARSVARAALVDAGIELACGVTAGAWVDGRLALSDGSFLEVAAVLWATGVVGPAFLAASGLDCDAAGCVLVDATLRSVSHGFVFAAGDCATIEGNPRPKAGVWAVRAGRPLADNLRRAARGRALRRWRPQSQALVILGLGHRRAVAWRNGVAVAGRPVWRWKDWIDRRWMRMYQEPMAPMAGGAPMRCGGCGAKVGAEVLAGALAGLPRTPGADVLIGLDAPDDAAVMLPPRGFAVVQSVDHFRAFIDDPFVFGEIAAAHALSDLHAMGARPWTALAVAAVPYASGDKMRTELADMLHGASGVLAADGCALVGGHSAEAAEAALGFRGHRAGRSGEVAAQIGAAARRCTGADQAARHRHRAGRTHAGAGARGVVAGGDREHADEQRGGLTDPARAWRGGMHRRHRLRAGGASDGDAASVACRRGALAGSRAGPAGGAGTR